MWQQQLELGEFPFPIIGIMRMGLKNWLKLGGKSGPTGFEEFKFDFEGARIPRHASVSFTLFGVSFSHSPALHSAPALQYHNSVRGQPGVGAGVGVCLPVRRLRRLRGRAAAAGRRREERGQRRDRRRVNRRTTRGPRPEPAAAP